MITSYNYSITINEEDKRLKLNILGDLNNFTLIKSDLYFTKTINLYQYFYSDSYSLFLDSKEIIFKNKLDHSQKFKELGLINYITGKRGDLIINYKVILNKHNLYNHYEINKEIINNLFNIA